MMAKRCRSLQREKEHESCITGEKSKSTNEIAIVQARKPFEKSEDRSQGNETKCSGQPRTMRKRTVGDRTLTKKNKIVIIYIYIYICTRGCATRVVVLFVAEDCDKKLKNCIVEEMHANPTGRPAKNDNSWVKQFAC